MSPVPRISVVVPIYRAMPFLKKCLDSLLSQKAVNDMEILCIDDCGGDDSVEYIVALMQSHPQKNRLRLYSMPHNSGASVARNYGLQMAQGEYVGFVDADDWCEVDMYSSLLEAVVREKTQWGYCIGQKDFANGASELLSQPAIPSGAITPDSRRKLLTEGVAYFWTGLYNRQFLINEAITFPDGKFSEDSYFWYTVLMHSESVAVIDSVGYHYNIQDNSVSRRPDITKAEQKQAMYSDFIDRMRSEDLYLNFALELDYLYIKKGLLIPLMIKAINHPDTTNSYYRQMIRQAATDKVDVAHNSYLQRNTKYRLLLSAFRISGQLVSKVLRQKFDIDPF